MACSTARMPGALGECLNGGADAESCGAGDFNGDRIVDCADAAAMILAWTGSDPVPAFVSCRGQIVHSIPLLNPRWSILLIALLAVIVRWNLGARGQLRA